MKKILSIAAAIILLVCASVYATEVTYSGTKAVMGLRGNITMYQFTSVGDGETFATKGPIKGWWIIETDNPDTQTVAGIAVTETVSGATHTFTFYPGVTGGNATCNFFVVR